MGLSVEVVNEWIRSVTCTKQLDKIAQRIEAQRDAIAKRVAAKAAKRAKAAKP